jgi:diaminohydroxyphosphoribosylaminopyrimidine deaminase/5-amino-6-(5-phosphoribosylamino)uracil reductase
MDAGPIVLVTRSSSATSSAAQRLRDAGATLVSCDGPIADAVGALARHDVMTLLVEGGPTLHAAMFEAGLVDRLAELVADHPLGPAAVRSGIPAGATDVRRRRILPLGRDVLMEGDVHRTD